MMPGEANDDVKFLTLTKIPPKVKNLLVTAPTYFLENRSSIYGLDVPK